MKRTNQKRDRRRWKERKEAGKRNEVKLNKGKKGRNRGNEENEELEKI